VTGFAYSPSRADRAARPLPDELRFGHLTVALSNTDKVFFPDEGFTKGEVIGYYHEIAERIMPYLRGRPMAMARYPDGIDGERIFPTNTPGHFPGWVRMAEVSKQGGTLRHVVCDNAFTLVYLANKGCIEVHVFGSRADRIDRPDQVVFDLDPAGARDFPLACQTALGLRELLEGTLGCTAYVRTTGGKGLHVHVPLDRRAGFDDVRAFARAVARRLEDARPHELTTAQRKDARSGRCSSTSRGTHTRRPSWRPTRCVPGPAHPSRPPCTGMSSPTPRSRRTVSPSGRSASGSATAPIPGRGLEQPPRSARCTECAG
jgi:bifunctional non-homologous end joining protein LigD